jgi:hypothetical protein
VAVVDFDVHHGNGTQACFEQDASLFYASSHQWPLYPGTGDAHETGVGNIVNALLPPGADGTAFRNAWEREVLPALEAFAPGLLVISAGFDAHARDPLAQLRVREADFAWLTERLCHLADRHCRGAARLHPGGGLRSRRAGRLHRRACARADARLRAACSPARATLCPCARRNDRHDPPPPPAGRPACRHARRPGQGAGHAGRRLAARARARHRALCAGQRHGHRRAPLRGGDAPHPRAPRGGREPRRRQRPDRGGGGCPRRAGRDHAAVRHEQHQRRRQRALPPRAVRHGARLRPRLHAGHRAAAGGGARRWAAPDPGRPDRPPPARGRKPSPSPPPPPPSAWRPRCWRRWPG